MVSDDLNGHPTSQVPNPDIKFIVYTHTMRGPWKHLALDNKSTMAFQLPYIRLTDTQIRAVNVNVSLEPDRQQVPSTLSSIIHPRYPIFAVN
jgi:hypothetical protein